MDYEHNDAQQREDAVRFLQGVCTEEMLEKIKEADIAFRCDCSSEQRSFEAGGRTIPIVKYPIKPIGRLFSQIDSTLRIYKQIEEKPPVFLYDRLCHICKLPQNKDLVDSFDRALQGDRDAAAGRNVEDNCFDDPEDDESELAKDIGCMTFGIYLLHECAHLLASGTSDERKGHDEEYRADEWAIREVLARLKQETDDKHDTADRLRIRQKFTLALIAAFTWLTSTESGQAKTQSGSHPRSSVRFLRVLRASLACSDHLAWALAATYLVLLYRGRIKPPKYRQFPPRCLVQYMLNVLGCQTKQ